MITAPEPTRLGDITRFGSVDRADDPAFFVELVDGLNRLDSVVDCKRRMLDCLDLGPGEHALDVGCGTGPDVRAMAARVAPGGTALGIDVSEVMLAEARRRSEGCGLPVEFRRGDVHRLDLPDASVDACRAERVLLHVEDHARAVSEMARVLRPGGRLAVYDFDLDAWILAGADPAVSRRVLELYLETIRHPHVARELPWLFRQAGLVDVRVIAQALVAGCDFVATALMGTVTAGVGAGRLAADEVERWLGDLRTAEADGHFVCAINGLIVTARKP
ncbi:MAG TPA: methyltransferase domain-containing protein [Candidatus Dormibacteraeota bacterium]